MGATADMTVSADGNGPLVLVDNGGNAPLFTADDDVKGPLFMVGAMGIDPFACSESGDGAGTTDAAAGFRDDVIGESNFRAGVAGVFGLIAAGRVDEGGGGIFTDGIEAGVGRVVMPSRSATPVVFPVPVGVGGRWG